MKIIIASDHGGFELKEALREALEGWGLETFDAGCHDAASVDYPDYAHQVAAAVERGEYDRGVLLCGTGIGMSIAANRHAGVRAALCGDCYSAEMTRAHNDANVLCMGARVIGKGLATKILRTFLDTPFEGGRHARRLEKLVPGRH
jgi:ribose 5-phosphate isomerase B